MSSYTGDGDQSGVHSEVMYQPHLHLVLFHVGRHHGIRPRSTIDQYLLLLPVNYGVAHIQRP